jgi:mercuric reductase
VIFTDPEVAAVGLTEARAREPGYEVRSVVMDLDVVARARVEGRQGRVKLVLEEKTGRLLGVHLVMPRAGEAIFAAHLALKAGMTVQDWVDSFAPYLTYAESLRLAAQAVEMDVHRLSCCA